MTSINIKRHLERQEQFEEYLSTSNFGFTKQQLIQYRQGNTYSTQMLHEMFMLFYEGLNTGLDEALKIQKE